MCCATHKIASLKGSTWLNSHKVYIAIFEGYLDGCQKTYKEYNLIPIINSLEQLERLNQYAIQENKPKATKNKI